MGATSGHQLVFKLASTALVQIKSAELTINGKTYDVTKASGTSAPPWDEIIPGTKSWSLKISGFYDMVGDAVQASLWTNFGSSTVCAVSISPDTGTHAFSGNAYITSIAPKFGVDGPEGLEYNFQGTGALSYA
jgi:predicted secreted protein